MARHIQKCIKRPLQIVESVPVVENSSLEDIGMEDISSQGIENISSHSYPSDCVDSLTSNSDVATVAGNIPSCSTSTTSDEPAAVCYISNLRKKNQSVISTYIDTMSNCEAEKLQLALARTIYSSNCPLALTDNAYWKKFFHEIRPSFKVPSRHDLTNRLLDKEYKNVMDANKDMIKKAHILTVITDGWSNIRSESIISFIVATPSPIFYKSKDTKSNRHTGQYIAEEIIEVINEVGGDKVVAIVTDNASNMKAAWRNVQMVYPNLNAIGCSAHGLNLLLGDIAKIETFDLIIARSKEIIKHFKNKQSLLSIFNEKQKQKRGSAASTLKLPAETRWNSTLIMFKSLLDGKESLQEAVLNENVDREIRKSVLDNDIFWASIESLSNVLKPICEGITKIESDTAVLSDVPHVFHNIKSSLIFLKSTPLQTDEEQKFILAVEERERMCCQPIHLAAYVLDPRYQENDLNSEEYRIAVDYLASFPSTVPGEIIGDFALFQAREGIYSNVGVWSSAKYVSPLVWWKGIFKSQSLSLVAVKLFSIPPSSAACERIFSSFSKTHTALRNRLSNERVSKLIAIRSHLILQEKMRFDDDISRDSDSE